MPQCDAPPLAAIHYQAVPGNSLATHQSAVELKNSRLAYFHDVAAVSLVCVGVPGLATLSALQTVHTLLSRPWLTRLNCSQLNKVRRYWREHVCSQPATSLSCPDGGDAGWHDSIRFLPHNSETQQMAAVAA